MLISRSETRIGWIGTGVMGTSMCGHLLAAGYSVTVYSRTKSKAEPLLAKGAKWADSPKKVAEASDVVFTMVGTPDDVREVILGPEGALVSCRRGAVLVDMTTSEPSLAAQIAEAARTFGIEAIDAPVSGGDVGARGGTLSIMIGGNEQTVADLAPLWSLMGSTYVHQGGPGSGQHTKMVNQSLIGGNMIGVCEALLYAYKAGLDLETVLQSVASGAAGSWSLSNLAPRMIAGDFDPGFFIEHFLKDLRIVLDEARQMNLKLPGTELAEQLYRTAAEEGHAKDGTQALIVSLAKLSNIDWQAR